MKYLSIILAVVRSLTMIGPASAQEISTRISGNAVEAIFIQVSGPIEPGFADRFRAHLEDFHEGYRVRLDSPGGSLVDGLEVGRVIRDRGLWTEIGNSSGDGISARTLPGVCYSACAIAFLGGSVRSAEDSMALGFHRFFRSTETETPPSAEIGDYEKALDLAQIVSGMIIAYMVEMGVDARVFTEASTKGRDELMRFERAAAEELGILTPHAFSRWFIEPYNGGIIAASRRQIPTHAYSLVTQATLYCSNGQATIMLTAPEATWLGADDFFANQGAWIYWQHPSGEVERENIPKSRVAVSTDDNGAQIRIRLSRDDVAAAVRATSFEVQLSVPRASGGFWFGRSLLENDGELLRSATTHCI